MNGPGYSRRPSSNNHLDPGAQEFFPSSVLQPQIFHPYPPPPYDNMMGVYARPAFLSAAVDPPPPPLPVSVPPSSLTPSRTLLLSMVPNSVSESTVRRELEVFGDVRAVQMERRREGLVTVHFYDVRDAEAALAAIQEQHMQQQYRVGRHYDAVLMNGPPHPFTAAVSPPQTARGLITGRVVWAQFTVPVTSGLPDGNNQGTLIVFNLDTRVSPPYLRHIFEAFGPVKELRETPNKRHQRFVEFYDVRNAARAMAEMNGRVIYGKAIVIEFSRPGGQVKKFWKGRPFDNGTTNYNRRNLNKRPPLSSSSPENNPDFHPRAPRRDDEHRGNYIGGSDGSKSWSSGSSSLRESITNLCIKSNCNEDESYCSNSSSTRPGDARKKNHCYFKKVNNNNSDGGGSSKPQCHGGGCKPWKGGADGGRRGKMEHDPRFLISEEDAIVESDCSIRDSRTTVMIKNIPNKYSQKLLLNMLDNHCIHCNEQLAGGGGGENDQPLSSYDFVYLPIDFINKCNVGYGFVNMTSPEATIRLYKAFHQQNWQVFNSRKICHVTYARLQGLEALREHFKNSKFPAGEAEEYMPVTFSPSRDGVAVPDPVPIVGGRSVTGGGSSPSPSSAASAGSSSKESRSSSEPPLVVDGLNGHNTDNGSSYDGRDDDAAGTGVDDENVNSNQLMDISVSLSTFSL